MWLAVASQDQTRAAEALEAHWLEGLDESQRAAAAGSFDLDSDELQCPACSTRFAQGPARCPGCGLRFG